MAESTGVNRNSMIRRRVVHLDAGNSFAFVVRGFVRALDVTRAQTGRRVVRIAMLTTPDDHQLYSVKFKLAKVGAIVDTGGFSYLGIVGRVAVFVDQTADRVPTEPSSEAPR